MVRTNNITFSYKEFEKPEDLLPEERELTLAASEAAERAYAPYSKFRVGAAIRLESGKIVSGANVENAAFPSGICAERSALSNSISNYPDDNPVAMAIVAMTSDGMIAETVSPCGNCRQVIAEEEFRTGKQIRMILSGRNKTQVLESIFPLLPLQFNRNSLRVDRP